MEHKKIGRHIAECRRKKNLTQLHLAERLGITDKAVSKWERGLAMPSYPIIIRLCAILDININELLQEENQ